MQFLADDDWLFPDHLERLATAMIRCGAKIAHANALIRYVTRLEDGTLKTTGYNAGVFTKRRRRRRPWCARRSPATR